LLAKWRIDPSLALPKWGGHSGRAAPARWPVHDLCERHCSMMDVVEQVVTGPGLSTRTPPFIESVGTAEQFALQGEGIGAVWRFDYDQPGRKGIGQASAPGGELGRWSDSGKSP
jgi:hypothetical protein